MRLLRWAEAILSRPRLRLAYGLAMLILAAVASFMPDLAINAVILFAIGLYFSITGAEALG